METSSSMSAASRPSWLVRLCDAVIYSTILGLAALLPLFFLPFSIEVLELNKQLLLVFGAAIAGIAWVGKMLIERKLEYRRSVVNVFVALFLVVYALSAAFSQSRYASLVGDFGQEMSGLVTVAALAILYFVIINNFKTAVQLTKLMTATVSGGFVVLLYGLLQGFGAFILPFEFARTASFNSVGTAASLALYAVFVLALVSGLLIAGHNQALAVARPKMKIAMNVFLAVTGVLAIAIVALIDFWPVTVCMLVAASLIVAFAFVHAKSVRGIAGIMLPVLAIVIGALVLLFQVPALTKFPAEVMPSSKASVSIAIETLRADPFLGSGPGTFLMDYAKYRSAEVNQTYFWNVRFDRATSQALTMAATVGLLGFVSWLLLALFLIGSAARRLFVTDEANWHLTVGAFAAFLALFCAKLLYSSTITLEFATWLAMALLVITHQREFLTVKFENSPRAAMSLSFVFILGLVFGLSGLFVEGQRYAAEIHFAQAVRMSQAGDQTDAVIDHLVKAANLNKANDVYLRNLSQALLTKANEEASAPLDLTQGEEESDDDFKNRSQVAQQDKVKMVAQLSADAVNIAKQATVINPANVTNWTVLAQVYGNLFGVTQDADKWALATWEKAIELEPNHPAHHTELGKVYLYQSEKLLAAADQKDEAAVAEAKTASDELLDKAASAFEKAIELKGDYAVAHYQLALTQERQGKLKEAIAKMEGVLMYDPQDVGVGFQLALLYFRGERKDDAVNLMEQVVRLQPSYSNARWYLAAMYEDRGDLDKAIEQIEKVKELNPDNSDIAKKLDALNAQKSAPTEPALDENGQPLPEPVEQPVENAGEPSVVR